jgi:YgiT-type zinc finger domain-containing protein
MTVIDRPRNDTITCMCGGVMVHKVDTITRVIRGQKVRIHNAPFYECLTCGEREFDLSSRISSIAVEAYRRGVYDVNWEDYFPRG